MLQKYRWGFGLAMLYLLLPIVIGTAVWPMPTVSAADIADDNELYAAYCMGALSEALKNDPVDPQARRSKDPQISKLVRDMDGHTKIESTVRYLGIEVDDALSIAEQIEL